MEAPIVKELFHFFTLVTAASTRGAAIVSLYLSLAFSLNVYASRIYIHISYMYHIHRLKVCKRPKILQSCTAIVFMARGNWLFELD